MIHVPDGTHLTTKAETTTHTATNLLIYSGVLPASHAGAVVAQTCGSNQYISDLICFMRWNPYPMLWGDQEPETIVSRELGENQTLVFYKGMRQ